MLTTYMFPEGKVRHLKSKFKRPSFQRRKPNIRHDDRLLAVPERASNGVGGRARF